MISAGIPHLSQATALPVGGTDSSSAKLCLFSNSAVSPFTCPAPTTATTSLPMDCRIFSAMY